MTGSVGHGEADLDPARIKFWSDPNLYQLQGHK